MALNWKTTLFWLPPITRLTGPIFDKELRISSRRCRNYLLRFLYLSFLTIFVTLAWLSYAERSGGQAWSLSRMAEAGKFIITTIIWFQFCATQLITVIMLSTAISDEIHQRTLGVLMTTPINSFQIVIGKLGSKLLQLVLLLAISLPLLALVRVFGGVPWAFVLSSLCITLTAIIFAGSLSMFFSITARRSFAVILKTLFTLGVPYAFVPGMIAATTFMHGGPGQISVFIMVVCNPFGAMIVNTQSMMFPVMGLPFAFWPLHCAIMLTASVLLLCVSIKIVRKVALRQATGQANPFLKQKLKPQQNHRTENTAVQSNIPTTEQTDEQAAELIPAQNTNHTTNQSNPSVGSTSAIRPVKGSPILWKELRAPFIQGGREKGVIGLTIAVIVLFITYLISADSLDENFAHATYILVFVLLGLVVNAVLAATTITSEKESRSWPILLASPLDNRQILWGKGIGVFCRCLPIWLFLAGHVLLFTLFRYIHPVAILQLGLIVIWTIVFLSGSGLYFSARFRHTTSAVVSNFTLALFLWLILPMLFGLIGEIFNNQNLFHTSMTTNPIVQAIVITEGVSGTENARKDLSELKYKWLHNSRSRRSSFGSTTGILSLSMVLYLLLGIFMAWRSQHRFRKNIF